ncbi:MAG TPA: ATP-binding protein [Candidatus Thermoplasmatota archaeon]|nr:ATP-binding protein [Candidatus Thermoplasmatota archaeon]
MPEGAQKAASGAGVAIVPTRVRSFADEQRGILEGIATGAPLAETLERIVKAVEAEASGMRASILLLEGDTLLHGAAPSLPAAYNDAIHGLKIGPGVGSCGTAAYTGAPCVVEDIQAHPYWAPFRELAGAHGLRACWSTPILGRGGVIGTFAVYYGEVRAPTATEERLIGEATHLASIAIQHQRLLQGEAERLVEARQRLQLRDLLRRAPAPVALIRGPDFIFDFANRAYEQMVGRSQVEGRRVQDLFPEIEGQGIIELLRSIHESGQSFENPELRVELDRGRGREEAWFSVRIEPYDEDGTRSLLVIGIEITAQVRARQDLDVRRAEIATREKTSALGQLVSGVAHEIRTPLTYLATNLNLIQLRLERLVKSLPPAQAEAAHMLVDQYIPSALEGVDRINHIVEDLREFTQLRHGVREPAQLRDVVGQAVSLFQATHRGHVQVVFEPRGDATLEVDRLQVQQAVLNLMQNALEAGPRDHRIIVRASAAGDQATVQVVDSGPGIPPEVQARMFDPFFTTKEAGTGLGLSIVKRVMDDHRGRVEVASGPSGTTFTLRLPLPGS